MSEVVLDTQLEVLSRTQPAKLPKIVDEMGLIVVTVRFGDIVPINNIPPVHSLDDAMKASDSTEELGRQTDLISKNLNETPLTEIEPVRQRSATVDNGVT